MSREALEEIYARYAAQPALAELAAGKRTVLPCGPAHSPLMVVGEAPGEDEERTGRPFTGKSGLLLRDLFRRAGIPWKMCYVTNTVFWRPPANRTPYPFQVQAAYKRLEQEIAVVDPVVVVAAGAVAWRAVTCNDMGPFERARFRWHDLGGRRLLAVPHPAFILRVPDRDRPGWEGNTTAALAQALTGVPA